MAQPNPKSTKGDKKVSNVQKVSYDPEKQVLSIGFSRGDVYDYFEVPPEVYAGLMAAGSRSTFFKNVIKGKYTFSKK